MSVVTTIILSFNDIDEPIDSHTHEYEIIQKVNHFLEEDCKPFYFNLKNITDTANWGGSKYPAGTMYGGAFNRFGTCEVPFLKFLLTLDWKDPQDVQILIQHEEASRFGILMFDNLINNKPIGYRVLCKDNDDVHCIFQSDYFEFEDPEDILPINYLK